MPSLNLKLQRGYSSISLSLENPSKISPLFSTSRPTSSSQKSHIFHLIKISKPAQYSRFSEAWQQPFFPLSSSSPSPSPYSLSMSTPPKTQKPIPSANDSWTIVSNRRNRKQSKSKPNPNPSSPQLETLTLKFPIPWSPSDPQSDPNLRSKLLSKLNSSFQKLNSSQFHAQFLSQFQSPLFRSALGKLLSLDPQSRQFQFVIYGIGSIDSYESPRLQLSLARVIYEHFKPQISSVEVFDPVISAVECTVIEELGITVLRKDEGGRREVKVPTLFFMPHCEVELYDNLLGANWGFENLNRMAILGNSFEEYERYVEEKRGLNGSVRVEEKGKRVIGSRRIVREVRVEGCQEGDDGFFRAFHDISWHFFDVDIDVDMNFV